MTKLMSCLAVFGFVTASAFGASSVTGKVNFTGATPKQENIKMNADPVCVKENAGKTVAKGDVVVNSNKTLANVFVYVKEGVKSPPPADTKPIEFDQKGCMYQPRIVGLRVNQPLKIINSDPTLHNVHALPKQNAGFNMGMATKGQTVEKKFTKPETMVRIKCDVHGWMQAYIGVLDHPYFAVTDNSGAFTIKDLPAGEYTVEAWHEKLGTKTEKITVTDGAPKTLDFSFGTAANG